MDWYQSMLPDAVIRGADSVDGVVMYRDLHLAIDHAPAVATPWALMMQYLMPFDRTTAEDIWTGFCRRFLVESDSGMWVQIAPGSQIEDMRTTCLATWLAAEIGDDRRHEGLLDWVDGHYEPRFDSERGEFAYWFGLDEGHPRGQWNNAIMNVFVAPSGTWTRILEDRASPDIDRIGP